MFKQSIAIGLSFACLASALAPSVANAQQNLRRLTGTIRVDGSSTVYPITEAVAEEFAEVAPRVNVTVGISGTGGGFKRFVAGETDISDASRPIKEIERERARSNGIEFFELPVAYDGLTIVVNDQNTWCKSLTVDQLREIFLDGGVNRWSELNPNWPDMEIAIYSPGTDSGTFDYFKEVVAGEKGSIRGDMSVSEDDNVLVRGVAGERGAIGFFGSAYYFENEGKLKAVAIDGGEGPVLPTPDTIADGEYQPFSRPLFIYVNEAAYDEKRELRAFIDFFLDNAGELANEVGYVNLPSAIYDRARAKLERGETGTYFLSENGEKLKGSLRELYR